MLFLMKNVIFSQITVPMKKKHQISDINEMLCKRRLRKYDNLFRKQRVFRV